MAAKAKNWQKETLMLRKDWLKSVDYIDAPTALELRKALKEYADNWWITEERYSNFTMSIFSQWINDLDWDAIDYQIQCYINAYNRWLQDASTMEEKCRDYIISHPYIDWEWALMTTVDDRTTTVPRPSTDKIRQDKKGQDKIRFLYLIYKKYINPNFYSYGLEEWEINNNTNNKNQIQKIVEENNIWIVSNNEKEKNSAEKEKVEGVDIESKIDWIIDFTKSYIEKLWWTYDSTNERIMAKRFLLDKSIEEWCRSLWCKNLIVLIQATIEAPLCFEDMHWYRIKSIYDIYYKHKNIYQIVISKDSSNEKSYFKIWKNVHY